MAGPVGFEPELFQSPVLVFVVEPTGEIVLVQPFSGLAEPGDEGRRK